jgi:hypothetical protein
MVRWWQKLKLLFRKRRRKPCVKEPLVWRKAGTLYVRQYQLQLKQLAMMLSRSRDEEVMVTFDSQEKAGVLYTDDERLALISVLRVKDGKDTMRVVVRSNLTGDRAYFQLAFLGLDFDWQPHVETLLLTNEVPREQ